MEDISCPTGPSSIGRNSNKRAIASVRACNTISQTRVWICACVCARAPLPCKFRASSLYESYVNELALESPKTISSRSELYYCEPGIAFSRGPAFGLRLEKKSEVTHERTRDECSNKLYISNSIHQKNMNFFNLEESKFVINQSSIEILLHVIDVVIDEGHKIIFKGYWNVEKCFVKSETFYSAPLLEKEWLCSNFISRRSICTDL